MKGKNNNKKDRKRQMENKTKNTCIHFSFHQHRNYGNYTQKKEKKSSQINRKKMPKIKKPDKINSVFCPVAKKGVQSFQ